MSVPCCFLLTNEYNVFILNPGARQNQLGMALLFSLRDFFWSPLAFDIRKVCFTLRYFHQIFRRIQPFGDVSLAEQLRGLLNILVLLLIHLFYLQAVPDLDLHIYHSGITPGWE